MTLEESIALAEKFQKDLAQVESYDRQIKDNIAESKKPITINVRRRSMFRYFWPWILFSGTLLCLAQFLALIIMTKKPELLTLVTILAWAIPIGLLILGIVISKKKAKEDNGAYEIAKEMAEEKRVNLLEQSKELVSKKSQLEFQLAANPNFVLIPEDKRKSSSMARAKLFLQSGKATDFEDAMKKV